MASELLLSGGIVVLLIKVTLVLTLSLVWATALARASASTRHLLWLTCLSLLLIVPLLSSVAPALRIVPLPAASTGAPAARETLAEEVAPADAAASVDGQIASAAAPDPAVAPPAAEPRRPLDAAMLLSLLLALWGAGSVLLLGRLALSEVLLRRTLRRSTPLEGAEWIGPLCEAADRLDLPDIPRLVLSEDAAMPFACGFRRPTIVLPKVAEGWDASRRQAVLFHELAHVRRHDLVGHTVARLVCALYWIHPMVWTAARRLRAESERACDDLALSVGIRASDYADHLLQIVTAVRVRGTSPAVALPFADRRELEGRVLAILDPVLHRGRPSGANVGALALLLLCGIAFSALAPAENAPASQPSTTLTAKLQGIGPIDVKPTALSGRESEEEIADAHEAALEHATPEVEVDVDPRPEPEPEPDVDPTFERALQAGNLPLLLNALATDPSPLVRKTAAWSMARFNEPAAAAALSRALQSDRDEDVREMAAWALQADRRQSGTDALLQALAGDASDEVRATAAWALGSMRPTAAVLPALERALSDRAEDVRQRAAWGIGSIEPDVAPIPLYRNALNDPAASVRETAAWALGQIRDPRATEALLARLEQETEDDVAKPIARALLLTTPRSAAATERLLRSANPEIRAMAIATAGGAGPPNWHWPWPWPWPRPNP